jgi:ethanolamine utilization protein EutN
VNLARVIGSIWATRRSPGVDGLKMLLIQPLTGEGKPTGRPLAAFDAVGCGPGETVIFVTQYEACLAFADRPLVPIDAAITAIVEFLEDRTVAVLKAADLGKAGS